MRLKTEALTETESIRLEQLLTASRRGMRSAKAIKDIHHNLAEFGGSHEDIQHHYLARFRESMQSCLSDLYSLPSRFEQTDSKVIFEELASTRTRLARRHDAIHENIYSDVREERVDESLVSTLLNVNREMYTCQLWLVLALADYHLPLEQAGQLEQLSL